MKYHLTKISSNAKTGPIPVSTSSRDTCPDHCQLKGKGGCYADTGPLGIHWNAVTNGSRGVSWEIFLKQIEEIPRGNLWRHNQAGDLPKQSDGNICPTMLAQLVKANHGKRGFTYTHQRMNKHNLGLVRSALKKGFCINASEDNPRKAAKLKRKFPDLPVVSVVPTDFPKYREVEGVKIVTCPAVLQKNRSCANCQLCYEQPRDYIIGFPAHGTRKKAVDLIASGGGGL